MLSNAQNKGRSSISNYAQVIYNDSPAITEPCVTQPNRQFQNSHTRAVCQKNQTNIILRYATYIRYASVRLRIYAQQDALQLFPTLSINQPMIQMKCTRYLYRIDRVFRNSPRNTSFRLLHFFCYVSDTSKIGFFKHKRITTYFFRQG